MADINTRFTECDTNGDGRLDLAEFKVFQQKSAEWTRNEGCLVIEWENHSEEAYELMNQVDPS